MKLSITIFVLNFFIINHVENAVAIITPRTAHTISLHPTTVKSTEYSTDSTRLTRLTSTSIPLWTTTHSEWISGSSTETTIRRIFLCVFLVLALGKFIQMIFKSKMSKQTQTKVDSLTVKNKMCVSTINGQREESPPKYADIHHV